MKTKTIFLVLSFYLGLTAAAQFHINPQIGARFTSFSNPPTGVSFRAKAGFMAGLDLHIGDKVQFQPGAFYVAAATASETTTGAVVAEDINHNYLKLKALVGFNLVDADVFRLRLNAGPSYDILLNAKQGDVDSKDHWNSGTFYLQEGVGTNILFRTAELGHICGLTKAFEGTIADDAKTFGFYVSVGVVF